MPEFFPAKKGIATPVFGHGLTALKDRLLQPPYGPPRRQIIGLPVNYFGDGSDGDLSTTGNVTVGGATNDDAAVIMNYKTLTINSGHALTTQARKKCLLVYVLGDCTIDGTLHMTAKGAKASATDDTDISKFAKTLNGLDAGRDANDLFSSEANQKTSGKNFFSFIVPQVGADGGPTNTAGDAGAEGETGGGGGGGRGTTIGGGAGSNGTALCGGIGGGGGSHNSGTPDPGEADGGEGGKGLNAALNNTGGGGGGAGNPGGGGGTKQGDGSNGASGQTGAGGMIILIVGGNLTIGGSGIIEANGKNGGNGGGGSGGAGGGGGAAGGGSVIVLYAGELSNTGTIQANGGTGGNPGSSVSGSGLGGGNGGAGSLQGPLKIDEAA